MRNMNVRTARLAAFPILALVLGSIARPAGADQSRSLNWSGAVPPGTTLAVHDVNGAIVADTASGSEASLVAHATSKLGDLSKVRLQVKQSANGILICAATPYEEVAEDCTIRHTVERVDSDHTIRIDFTVHVPRGIDFEGHTVNGRISAQGLSGKVSAKTVNGSITITTSALASAETVNGNIEARVGDAKWPGNLSFATVNGSINVAVAAGASFKVTARTLHGTIDARSFGLEPNRGFVGRSLDGSVGSNAGGKSISLRTVNGSIALGSLGGTR
jgi:hypothetical protein